MQIFIEWIERANPLAHGDPAPCLQIAQPGGEDLFLYTSIHPAICLHETTTKEANSPYLASQILGPTCQVHLV